MKTLAEIDSLAKAHAEARGVLAERVTALQDELATLRRRRLPGIKLAVGAARETRERLERAIDDSRPLFADPKTITLHGIRVGLQKGKGRIEWTDEAAVVAAIEKRLAARAGVLLKVTKKPVKKALAQLSVQDLKAIGCTVIEAGDEVFVKAADDDVDKLVAALLEEQAESAGAEE
jgi:hypothetical protein